MTARRVPKVCHNSAVEQATLEERFRAPLIAAAAILLGVAPAVGIALAPTLLVHGPLSLIALNPAGSYLVVVATLVPMVLFVAVAATRRTLVALLGYSAGYLYGDRTLKWIEQKSKRLGSFSRVLERSFAKAGPLLLVVAPGMTFATLAGMAKMRLWVTTGLMLTGQIFWMSVTFYVGAALREWIAPLVAWVSQYMVEATVFCVLSVVSWHAWRRRGKARSAASSSPFDLPRDEEDFVPASLPE